jgi:hypothetical protein
LFNGNLVFEKNRVRFIAFVNAYNARYEENLEVSSAVPCVTLNDAWLSGFTDAEGCFTVSVIERHDTRKKPYQVQARFVLAQKNGEKELTFLSKLIGGRLSFQKSYNDHNLSVQVTHLKVTLRYFRQFPLKTIKRISLIKFLAIYTPVVKSISEKQPLTSAELSLIRRRAKEINKIVELVEDKVRPTE